MHLTQSAMAPANAPLLARRPSTRTRSAASMSYASSSITSNTSPGRQGSTLTRAQQQQQQAREENHRRENDSTSATSSVSTPTGVSGRPGRPRKDLGLDMDRPRKTRGRPPKTKDPSPTPSSSYSRSPSAAPGLRSPSASSAKDAPMDADEEETAAPLTRRRSATRQSGRQSAQSKSRESSPKSETRTASVTDNHETSVPLLDQEEGQESGNSDDDNGDDEDDDDDDDEDRGSDEDHKERKQSKTLQGKSNAGTSKRFLRSSRLSSKGASLLDDDVVGQDLKAELGHYTLEQQRLKSRTTAANVLIRIIRQGVENSEQINAEMVNSQEHELIQRAFGTDIEELSLNLAGHMSATDESSEDDDGVTLDLKREHRHIKALLNEASLDYKEMRKRAYFRKTLDLDEEEVKINAGTHPDLLAELQAIEQRKQARRSIIEAQKEYTMRMHENAYQAACKAANDQYHSGQVTARQTIIDMVQSRINKVKQEYHRSPKDPSLMHKKLKKKLRAAKRKSLEGLEVASCGESCSSYDSYSSSGSDCSDCEICKIQSGPKVPRITAPRGLSRKEVEIDLAFLFPHAHNQSQNQTQNQHRPLQYARDDASVHSDLHPRPNRRTNERPFSLDYEEPKLKQERTKDLQRQQQLIDQLNEDKRRKRRFYERELQGEPLYKKLVGDFGGEHVDVSYEADHESVDQGHYEELQHMPSRKKDSATGRSSRPSHQDTDRRPRFLPGFGPDGLQVNGGYSASVEEPMATPPGLPLRYPPAERHAHPREPLRSGAPASPPGRDDSRPYPIARRDPSGAHDTRPHVDQQLSHAYNRNGRPTKPDRDSRDYPPPAPEHRSQPPDHYDSSPGPRYSLETSSGPRPAPPPGPPNRSRPLHYATDPYLEDPSLLRDPYEDYPPRKRPPPSLEPGEFTDPRGRPVKNARLQPWEDPDPNPPPPPVPHMPLRGQEHRQALSNRYRHEEYDPRRGASVPVLEELAIRPPYPPPPTELPGSTRSTPPLTHRSPTLVTRPAPPTSAPHLNSRAGPPGPPLPPSRGGDPVSRAPESRGRLEGSGRYNNVIDLSGDRDFAPPPPDPPRRTVSTAVGTVGGSPLNGSSNGDYSSTRQSQPPPPPPPRPAQPHLGSRTQAPPPQHQPPRQAIDLTAERDMGMRRDGVIGGTRGGRLATGIVDTMNEAGYRRVEKEGVPRMMEGKEYHPPRPDPRLVPVKQEPRLESVRREPAHLVPVKKEQYDQASPSPQRHPL